MFPPRLNPIEPPWYGPVCPVAWEGRCREAFPYPDLRRIFLVAASSGEGLLTERKTVAHLWRRELAFMSSRPEDLHLRALPDPYVNLSIHTAPDVRPFP